MPPPYAPISRSSSPDSYASALEAGLVVDRADAAEEVRHAPLVRTVGALEVVLKGFTPRHALKVLGGHGPHRRDDHVVEALHHAPRLVRRHVALRPAADRARVVEAHLERAAGGPMSRLLEAPLLQLP